jgi:hypothetical protein
MPPPGAYYYLYAIPMPTNGGQAGMMPQQGQPDFQMQGQQPMQGQPMQMPQQMPQQQAPLQQ